MIIQKAINQSLTDTERGNLELKNINDQISLSVSHFVELERDRREIEDKIDENLNERVKSKSKIAGNCV